MNTGDHEIHLSIVYNSANDIRMHIVIISVYVH